MRISLNPAFVLHHRDYRETSLLLDVLTQDHGRISLVARGVRTSRSKLRPLLQPFAPLLMSWSGKTELMTLQTVEAQGLAIPLKGECLFSGFYLNELLTRTLQKQDPNPRLYTIYQETLLKLATPTLQQKFLRLFEKKLLEELGYGLPLKEFNPDQYYRYYPEQGFVVCERNDHDQSSFAFSGKNLSAFAKEELETEEILQDAKRLMRMALTPLLGSQPLQSRKMFVKRVEVET